MLVKVAEGEADRIMANTKLARLDMSSIGLTGSMAVEEEAV